MKNKAFSNFLIVAAASIGAIALAPAAMAQETMALDGTVLVEKTVMEDGVEKTVLLPPATVIPGDHLVFTTTYRNDGAEAVEDFVVTNPVPEAVALSSSADADLIVSVDGGKNFGILSSLTVIDEIEGKRPAIAADVTHIRWTLAVVKPGEGGSLTYQAVVR